MTRNPEEEEAAPKFAEVADDGEAAEEAEAGAAKCIEERLAMHGAATGPQCKEAAAAAVAEAQLSLTEQQQQHAVNMAVVEDGMAQLRLSLLDPQLDPQVSTGRAKCGQVSHACTQCGQVSHACTFYFSLTGIADALTQPPPPLTPAEGHRGCCAPLPTRARRIKGGRCSVATAAAAAAGASCPSSAGRGYSSQCRCELRCGTGGCLYPRAAHYARHAFAIYPPRYVSTHPPRGSSRGPRCGRRPHSPGASTAAHRA